MSIDRGRLLFLATLLIAFTLRLPGLFANHFHADEALFASWARQIAVWRDPLLLAQPVDKPPLLFYLQALFFPMFGPVEWAARLPNFIASLLLVPLTGRLAGRLAGDGPATIIAALVVALSPLAIQFSPTAFTDPLLTVWLVGGLLALANGRPSLSGLCFGLALATKFQAALFLPLLIGWGWLNGWGWQRWLAGLLPSLLGLAVWTALRPDPLLATQWGNFGGLRLAWSWELWPRLSGWGRLGWLAAGPAWALAALTWVTGRKRPFVALLALFTAAYAAFHWLTAVPVWDRYLLPLVPLTAVLAGTFYHGGRERTELELESEEEVGGAQIPQSVIRNPQSAIVVVFVLLMMLPGAWRARDGRYPVGGGPKADAGAHQIGLFLDDAPYGTVLYDHWYSWQWRYHLFDSRVYVSWFPGPAALVEDLAVFGAGAAPRYLALTDGDAARPVLHAVRAAGFEATAVFQTSIEPGIILYQIDQ